MVSKDRDSDTSAQPANQVYMDGDGILCVVYRGNLDEAGARDVYNRMKLEALDHSSKGKLVNVLADIREMGTPTPEAMRVGVEIREEFAYDKMAIIVPPTPQYAAQVSKVLSEASTRHSQHIGYFTSDAKAKQWLLAPLP